MLATKPASVVYKAVPMPLLMSVRIFCIVLTSKFEVPATEPSMRMNPMIVPSRPNFKVMSAINQPISWGPLGTMH